MSVCKVLFITTSKKISGAELSLLDLLEKLDQNRFKCFVATNINTDLISRLPSKTNAISLKLIWFKKSFNPFYILTCVSNVILNACRLTRIIKKNEIQVIYANTTKACIYGIFVKICTKTKLVWHVRDNVTPGHLTNMLIRGSDRIICVSRYIYNQIICSNDKKKVIYIGIDINDWNPLVNPMINIRDSLNLKQEVRLVAQIAQITKWKNHQDFIEVAKIISQQYDKVHFIIIGECISQNDYSYKNSLLQIIDKYNLGNRISFLGWFDNIAEIYHQVDLVLFPSIKEPFGRVLIEAMAMKKPIVAYNCGGPKEIIKNNETGFLINPFDYKGLAEKGIELLNKKTLQKQFGEAGRKKVKNEFNINLQVKKLEEVLENLK